MWATGMKKLEWSLRARQYDHINLVKEAKSIVRRAIEKADFTVSWSAGKDSTAMTHLVKSVCPDIPIIIQFDDCDWLEKEPYVERIIKKYGWNIHRVYPKFSIWEQALKTNIGTDNICAQSHNLTKYGFIDPLDKKRKQLNCDGAMLGLRMKESIARKINLASRGPIYETKKGGWRCCPLWNWEARDVFAYMTHRDIEINPCYLKNKFLEPEEIRLSWALPTPSGISRNDMAHIRYYYPEHYRKLRDAGVSSPS